MDIVRFVRNQWDRVGAWLCVISGAVALLAGYIGVSGTLETGKQLPYVVSGGILGLFLLGLGALLWLSADLRDEWRKLEAINRYLQHTETEPSVSSSPPGVPEHHDVAAQAAAANNDISAGTVR